MRAFSCRLHEQIYFPSINATVQVLDIRPGIVRLGIDAGPEVSVLREEVPDREAEWGAPDPEPSPLTASAGLQPLESLTGEGLKTASIGLGLARLQLRAGRTQDAQATIDLTHEGIQALRRRLEEPAPAPRPRPVKVSCRRKKGMIQSSAGGCAWRAQ